MRHVGDVLASKWTMPWKIPNYDSLKLPAADEQDQVDDGWDLDKVELDVEELEEKLRSR
jgi:hypothetical protein